MMKTAKKIIKLKPIKANPMIATEYNRQLKILLKELSTELMGNIRETYDNILDRASDKIALDDVSDDFVYMLKMFFGRWKKRFEQLSGHIASYHIGSIDRDTRDKLIRSAKDLITIKPDADYRSIARLKEALINENVNLIVRLPSDMYNKIHRDLMLSIQTGNNTKRIYSELIDAGLPPLTRIVQNVEKEIQSSFKRAKFIARDQVLKATGLINNQRMLENGIDKAIWRHSGGDKVPRPDHLEADGKVFDTAKGMKLKDGYVLPGYLINCTCFAEPVIEV